MAQIRQLKRRWIGFVVAAIGLPALSCTGNEYGVSIWNKTGAFMPEAMVFYGDQKVDCGNLVVNGNAGYGYVVLPIPDKVEVRWMVDEERYSAAVLVGKWIREGQPFKGEMYFVINPDQTVSFIPVRDEQAFVVSRQLGQAPNGKALEPKAPV